MLLKNPAFRHIKLNKISDDLDRKFKCIDPEAVDLIKKCLVMDPVERQDCKSLLTHSYFDSFTDVFEEEIQTLLDLDTNEFQKKKLRMTSQERTDENNILTPRDPGVKRKPQMYKTKDKSEVKTFNENWTRKEGTPSFNKLTNKKLEKATMRVQKPVEKSSEEDEFNISFTNENYNPMVSQSNRNLASNEEVLFRANKNKDEIIINTREQPQLQSHNKGPTKIVHLTEAYNNDSKLQQIKI